MTCDDFCNVPLNLKHLVVLFCHFLLMYYRVGLRFRLCSRKKMTSVNIRAGFIVSVVISFAVIVWADVSN